VLQLLAAGQANKEIARTLALSPNTVKTHLARLFEKLEASSRTAAIARGRALGLIG
jgi:DNA-binding NarL/FixJ family response regulator